MQSFITLLNKVETLRTLFFVVLFTLSTTTFAQDPIQSITEASAEINETLGELSTVVESFVNQGNPNTQVLEFKPIVDRLEAFLKSTYFEEIIKNNVTYYHYNKLMQNHLLHINLQNEISASKELHNMYPHELPFHHDGRFPAKPTLEALDKIKVFLEVLSSDINDQSTETIFLEPRIEQAIDFIKQVYAHMKQHEKSNETLKILNDESLQKNPNETTQAYFGRLKNKLRSKPNSLKIILSQKIKSLKEKELHTLKSLTSKPMETYLLFKKRIEQDGINASFPEYGDVVRQMVLWLKTSGNVENAIKNQPSLNLMRLDALKHLELSLQRNIPYRQTLDALMRASEFLDITERTLHPEKANPLHYAKRYEYYLHYVLGLAPKHFSIPSTISLSTYSLLEIGGAPLGIGGFTDINLWVDSYLQTPNEFTLHDWANHERRRYQFTQNYAIRLGVSEENIVGFYTQLDRYNRSSVLPMIRRFRLKELDNINFTESSNSILTQFTQLLGGSPYFQKEILELKNKLSKSKKKLDSKELRKIVNQTRKKINDKKKLFDMILFEVVHEDALPPARLAIIESIMRPPNLPMPRDHIDIATKTAMHSMEKAGSTMSYIIHKLNGSFYDTPEKRLQSIATAEYRSPKRVIEITSELIMNLGGHRDWSYQEVLKNIIYLTMTDEGFLSYLLDEFQRDLHPIQRDLINSLKYAESLEMLGLIDEFDHQNPEFIYYLKMIRKKIQLASSIKLSSSEQEVKKAQQELLGIEDSNYASFTALQSKYYRVSEELNEKLFSDINMLDQRLDQYSRMNLKQLKELKKNKLKQRQIFNLKLSSDDKNISNLESIESLTFEIEDIDRAISVIQNKEFIQRTLRENTEQWREVDTKDISRSALIESFSHHLHNNTWLNYYRQRNKDKARFKELPKELYREGESSEQLKRRLEKNNYYGFKTNVDGQLEQDINVHSSAIVPELHEKLTVKAVEKYVDSILKAHSQNINLDENLIHEIAFDFHRIWMECNTWQLNKSFQKLNLNIPESYSIDELAQIIKNLSEKQWNSLTVNEIEKMRQFYPTQELKEVDKRRNITVIMSLISEQMRIGTVGKILRTHKKNWQNLNSIKAFLNKDFQQKFALKMHDSIWRANFQKSYGNLKKWVDLPANVFEADELPKDSLMRLQNAGFKDLQLDDQTNRVQQNINQAASDLHPSLMERSNLNLSRRYIEAISIFIENESVFNIQTLEKISEKFHLIFLQENRWHLKSSFKNLLGKDPEDMTISEIIAEIRMLDKNSWMTLSETETQKYRQFVPTSELPWEYHKGNVEMVELLLKQIISTDINSGNLGSCNNGFLNP